jgi:hypothetical protein
MTQAPERIWATFDIDISAQTTDIYAQDTPDGFVDKPVEYIRADIADQRIAELETTIKSCRAVLKAEKLCDYCDEADPMRQAMCLAKECGVAVTEMTPKLSK